MRSGGIDQAAGVTAEAVSADASSAGIVHVDGALETGGVPNVDGGGDPDDTGHGNH